MNKNLLSIFAIIVFVGVAVCFQRGIDYLFNYRNEALGITWISLGIALLGALTGVVSYYISKESSRIATESDEKMKEIANMNFVEALKDFEYTRMKIINPEESQYDVSTFIWRSLSDCERIAELNKDYIKPKHQRTFVDYYCASMEVLYHIEYKPLKLRKIKDNERKQIIQMYLIVRKYANVDNGDSRLQTARKELMKQTDDESESDFFNRVITKYDLLDYPYL